MYVKVKFANGTIGIILKSEYEANKHQSYIIGLADEVPEEKEEKEEKQQSENKEEKTTRKTKAK